MIKIEISALPSRNSDFVKRGSDFVKGIVIADNGRQLFYIEAERIVCLDAISSFILTLKEKALGV